MLTTTLEDVLAFIFQADECLMWIFRVRVILENCLELGKGVDTSGTCVLYGRCSLGSVSGRASPT